MWKSYFGLLYNPICGEDLRGEHVYIESSKKVMSLSMWKKIA